METWLKTLVVGVVCSSLGFIAGQFLKEKEDYSCIKLVEEITKTMEKRNEVTKQIKEQNEKLVDIAAEAVQAVDIVQKNCAKQFANESAFSEEAQADKPQ